MQLLKQEWSSRLETFKYTYIVLTKVETSRLERVTNRSLNRFEKETEGQFEPEGQFSKLQFF